MRKTQVRPFFKGHSDKTAPITQESFEAMSDKDWLAFGRDCLPDWAASDPQQVREMADGLKQAIGLGLEISSHIPKARKISKTAHMRFIKREEFKSSRSSDRSDKCNLIKLKIER